MTSIEDLVSDTSQHVRAALGIQISGLAPILGKEEYAPCRLILYDSIADKSQDYRPPSTDVPSNAKR